MAEIIILGLFPDRFTAAAAAERLVATVPVDPAKIVMHGPGEAAGAVPLGRLGLPWEDHAFYAEGMRRDRVVLTAVVDDTHGNQAAELLESGGAMDLAEQEDSLRQEGWTLPPAPSGFTGHDEDIGFATYGADAVVGAIPKRHTDNTPAGLLGRWEQATMQRDPGGAQRCSRRYVPAGG